MRMLSWSEIENKLHLEKELAFADIFSIRELNLFFLRYHPDQEVDKKKAEEIIHEIYDLVNSGLYLGLNDARGPNLEISKEAREVYSNNKSLKKTRAQAVLVNDLGTRILLNFFVNFNKPTVPVKLFNSFDKALEWLISFEE